MCCAWTHGWVGLLTACQLQMLKQIGLRTGTTGATTFAVELTVLIMISGLQVSLCNAYLGYHCIMGPNRVQYRQFCSYLNVCMIQAIHQTLQHNACLGT